MPDIWRIYFISKCCHTTPQKDKLAVIVCLSEKPMGFLINTDIPQFIKNNPSLLVCQVIISVSDYECLTHDSYVDCVQLYPFENDELTAGRDNITEQTKLAIKMAVSISETIERGYRKSILS